MTEEQATRHARPEDTRSTWERIRRLAPPTRARVLERSATLIRAAGLPPHEADARALAEEVGS